MSELSADLSPQRLGAEILVRLARERRDGELIWALGDQQRKILFKQGRPEMVASRDGSGSSDRQQVIALVRAFATAAAGQCVFQSVSQDFSPGLGIDTLGETLVALALGLRADQLAAIWTARGAETIESVSSFDRFSAALAQVGGARVNPPAAGTTVGSLVAGASEEEQRAWVALISLGAVRTARPTASTAASPTPSGASPEAATSAPTATSHSPAAAPNQSEPRRVLDLPDDLEARGLALEIERIHTKLPELDHYQLLEVDRSASPERIREAYFEVAKRWHSDRFTGYAIGEGYERKAEEVFRRAGEAHEILSDPEKRKSYDFVEERKAQGLPIDVSVILEAEGLFRKGQALVRRGQAAQAEAVLRQAVEMNKGEAEFWAYLGFAIYSTHGSGMLSEARDAINKALEMNSKLGVAHEFLGRIARVEGNVSEAKRQLNLAIRMNRKNVDAERELRLLNLREEKQEDKSKGLFGGLFKKS
jgi:curved DNA-binding protein CbpA